ncbi:MAG: DAK2 domain-containing protein [Gracilibacteraceae bacterium]|nr:DAK2 domain-containing protein [Gracilibacteraceae bacterium]
MTAEKITSVLNGEYFQKVLLGGAQMLERQKQEVDALNVFPVPDGDTGTNMFLTYRAAVDAAVRTDGQTISEVAREASNGSLMGARGNSGVILSQIMRGFARGLDGMGKADAVAVANALQAGVDTAYRAVMKPVEGTILTVVKELAKGALASARAGETDIAAVLRAAIAAGETALARTPELLPVLKQAGVVDAGGKGLLVILNGWLAVLEGKETVLAEVPAAAAEVSGELASPARGIVKIDDLEFPYCTEFLVKGGGLNPDAMRQALTDKGDCLLVVGTEEVVKIHIHTKNPGEILTYAIQFGALHNVQISNMLSQNEAVAHERREQAKLAATGGGEEAGGLPASSPAEPPAAEWGEYGFVAVTMGEGIAEVFQSLGVDRIVTGGQTMNPSTQDLAEAVRQVPARNVFILPNNSNIIMAAGQVNELVDNRQVHVVPTKAAPQAVASLVAYNPDAGLEENMAAMTAAIDEVSSGEVTYAVRDSSFDGINIHAGDVLGLVEGKIVTACADIEDAALRVLDEMAWRERNVVTVFYGEETTGEAAGKLADRLRSESADVEIDVHAGRQPLYYYILGVE